MGKHGASCCPSILPVIYIRADTSSYLHLHRMLMVRALYRWWNGCWATCKACGQISNGSSMWRRQQPS